MPETPELKKTPEPERVFERENDFDFRTLSFVQGGHIDVPSLGRFNPFTEIAEIKKTIKALPKDSQSVERVLMADDFKRKLKIFRENLSKAQLDFENLLRANQDKDLDWLYEATLRILVKYSVQSQEPEFIAAIDKFLEIRQIIQRTVLEYKEKFREDWETELFRRLFGRWPRDRVEIEIMPINLYFRIYNRQDYILANQGTEENSQNSVIGLKSAGASLNMKLPLPQLNNLILIENASLNLSFSEQKAISIHEEEHAIHKLYPSLSMVKYEASLPDSTKLEGRVSFDEFLRVIQRHAKFQSLYWDSRAKGEILAYLKDKRMSLPEIFNSLISSELYDYFAIDIDFQVNHIFKHISKHRVIIQTKTEGGQLNKPEIAEQVVEALQKSWDVYKLRISNILSLLQDLLQEYVTQLGEEKGREEVLRLLSQEPLNKWGRLSKLMFNS